MSLLAKFARAAAFLGLLVTLCQGTQTLAGTTGSVQGYITDANNRPIAGAAISVIAPSYSTHTVSGTNGFYAVNGLPPDTYTVTAVATGFATTQVPGITVTQDQTARTDIKLATDVKVLGKQ